MARRRAVRGIPGHKQWPNSVEGRIASWFHRPAHPTDNAVKKNEPTPAPKVWAVAFYHAELRSLTARASATNSRIRFHKRIDKQSSVCF